MGVAWERATIAYRFWASVCEGVGWDSGFCSVIRVQDERWRLEDGIALRWEYRVMEQPVEPKQDINEGMKLVY